MNTQKKESVNYTYMNNEYAVRKTGSGRYEVRLGERTGFFGVNLEGTERKPFAITTEINKAIPQGISGGEPCGPFLKFALDTLCQRLFEMQEEEEMRQAFDRRSTEREMEEAVNCLLKTEL